MSSVSGKPTMKAQQAAWMHKHPVPDVRHRVQQVMHAVNPATKISAAMAHRHSPQLAPSIGDGASGADRPNGANMHRVLPDASRHAERTVLKHCAVSFCGGRAVSPRAAAARDGQARRADRDEQHAARRGDAERGGAVECADRVLISRAEFDQLAEVGSRPPGRRRVERPRLQHERLGGIVDAAGVEGVVAGEVLRRDDLSAGNLSYSTIRAVFSMELSYSSSNNIGVKLPKCILPHIGQDNHAGNRKMAIRGVSAGYGTARHARD